MFIRNDFLKTLRVMPYHFSEGERSSREGGGGGGRCGGCSASSAHEEGGRSTLLTYLFFIDGI
jgi:hypothetical protein